IEAAFSQGLPNTPMSHAKIRIISGNFVTARPVGIIDGQDFQHTGAVRKIDIDAIKAIINEGAIVLLSPLGFSPTGEAFNLAMEDLATSAAVALRAEKLIFLTQDHIIKDEDGATVTELPREAADRLLNGSDLDEDTRNFLTHASR